MSTPADPALPVYQQVAPELALYALSSRGEAAVPGYWAGFRATAAPPPGPTLTIEASWVDIGGLYLFSNRSPGNPARFVGRVNDWLTRHRDARFLWLDDPDASDWRTDHIDAIPTQSAPTWRILRPATVTLGGYSLVIAAEARIRPFTGAAGSNFTVQPTASDQRPQLAPPLARYRLRSGSVVIPLTGPGLGAWTGAVLEPDNNALVGLLGIDPLNPVLPARTFVTVSGSATPSA